MKELFIYLGFVVAVVLVAAMIIRVRIMEEEEQQ